MARHDTVTDGRGRPQTARMQREAAQAKEKAEAPTKRYYVTDRGTIKFDGDRYAPGKQVKLCDQDAEQLLEQGAISKTAKAAPKAAQGTGEG